MTSDFARAMSRATASVRAGNLSEATGIIQSALAGRPEPGPDAAVAPRGFRSLRHAEDAEIVEHRTSPVRAKEARTGRSLRETIALLRRGRGAFEDLELRLPGGGPLPAAPPLPAGASFVWRNHVCSAGSRRYRLFVPSCPPAELEGLVLMLHGCKQDPDDFAAGTGMNRLAEEARMIVAYPEQPAAANVSRCWNWFDPAHQGREGGEPAILAALARDLAVEFGLPESRAYAAGLSAGGAMAATLAETHPEVFAAVGVHSGLPHRSARDIASAFAAMRGQGPSSVKPLAKDGPRVIVFHGAADRTVHPANAAAIVDGRQPRVAQATETGSSAGRNWRRTRWQTGDGVPLVEFWLVDGAGHAWSGGNASGSFADASGPSASAEMLRFFKAGRDRSGAV